MLRSLSFIAPAAGLALAMGACSAPDVVGNDTVDKGPVVTAVFDPTTSQVPLPNDLVFLNPVNGVCSGGDATSPVPQCIQADLLHAFSGYVPANQRAVTGEFPNDQEVAITIDFTKTDFFGKDPAVQTAPELDFTTFTASNFYVVNSTASGQVEVPLEPLTAADYVVSSDGTHGTLTIHHQGRTPWPTGSYALVIRGGANGVKTKDNLPVHASQIFNLLAQDVDLTDLKNLGLLRAQFGSAAEALAQGTQLNVVRLFTEVS
jgi:hypothetical protein